MTFDAFIKEYDGKGIDWDGSFGYQCYDLAHAYAVKVVGIDVPASPAAKDLWTKTISGYDKIKNTPDGVPQKGSIVIWGTDIGPYGHVAVFIDGNTSSFTSFDQNFPTGSLCHKQQHSYKGVLGWFEPKTTVSDALSVPKVDFERMVRKSTAYDLLCKHLGFDTTTTDGAKLIDEFEKARRSITEKEAELKICRQDLQSCQTNLSNANSSNPSNNSTGSPTDQPNTGTTPDNSDSGATSGPDTGVPQGDNTNTASFIQAIIDFFKSLFKRG